MFQRILTAVDNSLHSDYSMEAALAIAKAYDAKRVVGIHVYAARLHETRFTDMESGLPERYQSESILKRQRDIHNSLISKGLDIISVSYLDKFENRCCELQLSSEKKSREGKNFAEILKEIEQGDYDLAVMGSHGIGFVENSLIGGVCERVARKTRKDLLIVKDGAALGGSIVVAIDGSPYSFWGLLVAIGFKKAFGCDIEAVAAFDPHFHQVAFKSIESVLSEENSKVFKFKEQEKLHEEIIDKGMAKLYESNLNIAAKIAHARGVEINTTLLSGKAYNEVLKHIKAKKTSLLIVGRIGLHHVAESDIGSNAENLLRLAPCSVFLSGRSINTDEVVKIESHNMSAIDWADDALKGLERVPSFARGMAKKAIEDYARENKYQKITIEIMNEATGKLLPHSAKRAMGIGDED